MQIIEYKKELIIILFLVIAILLSRFALSPVFSDQKTYRKTIETLDEKKANVLEMTATASAASIALAAIPGDATTPVADKIIDMAGYFIIILSVIILEKYMMTLAGYLAFSWLFPISFLLIGISLFYGKKLLRQLALKIILMAAAILLIVPLSVKFTKIIEKNHESSIQSTMENFKEIEKEAEATTALETVEPSAEEESSSPLDSIGSIRERILKMIDQTRKNIEEMPSTAARMSEEMIEKAKTTMNDFVEIVVIMLVTTCGIPILALLFLSWIIKGIMSLNLDFIS
ncbi:MAG: hypothetical protein IJH71_07215 [Eubacterium sp.]|nr:hypothetical protein [Eubacterium sp.]